MALALDHRRLTTSGAIWLALCAILSVVGMARGDGLLLTLTSGAFGMCLFARWWGLRQLRSISITWKLPAKAQVGRRYHGLCQIDFGNLPCHHEIVIELQAPSRQTHVFSAERLAWQSMLEKEMRIVFDTRGERPTQFFRVCSSFPWGWWHYEFVGEIPQPLTIVPRALPPKWLGSEGASRQQNHGVHSQAGSHSATWRALREWRAGDPLKHLHLAASSRSLARGGCLMVAEHESMVDCPTKVVVMFHSVALERAIIRPENFEHALCVLAGTLQQLVDQHIPATLVADFDTWWEHPCHQPRDLLKIMELLAQVRRAGATERHEWQYAQQQIESSAELWMISDMPAASWVRGILPRSSPARVIATNKKTRTIVRNRMAS